MRVGLYTARPLGEAISQIVTASGVEVAGRVHRASGWWGTAGIDRDDDVFGSAPDLVVSCLTHHLFTPAQLALCRVVNLHPAPLPEYRGCNSYSHAIMNGEATYGVTLHEVDEGIDTGPVIDEHRFPIGAEWTARQLHDRAQAWAAYVFTTWWTDLIDGLDHHAVAQDDALARYYRRDSLDPFRDLADHHPSTHDRIRRALTFPPHPMPKEPAAC